PPDDVDGRRRDLLSAGRHGQLSAPEGAFRVAFVRFSHRSTMRACRDACNDLDLNYRSASTPLAAVRGALAMQFGSFTIADITPDPTTGEVPTENERLRSMVEQAELAEQVGLDVFAIGEHHNPPFVTSSPTTTLAYVGARTESIILSTATT